MVLLGAADLLDDVWLVLSADPEFLAFKGLDTSSDDDSKMDFIVKEEQTDELVNADTIPLALLYERPGATDRRTTQVYVAKVVLACYASSSHTARQMADRACALLNEWRGGSAFSCQLAHRSSFHTGIPGVAGYRVYFDFNTLI